MKSKKYSYERTRYMADTSKLLIMKVNDMVKIVSDDCTENLTGKIIVISDSIVPYLVQFKPEEFNSGHAGSDGEPILDGKLPEKEVSNCRWFNKDQMQLVVQDPILSSKQLTSKQEKQVDEFLNFLNEKRKKQN